MKRKIVEPKDNEWWMCRNNDSIMGLEYVYFYKDGQFWYGANDLNEIKEPFSASKFYEHNLTPLYRMVRE